VSETRERLTPEEHLDRQRRLWQTGELAYGTLWQAQLSRDLEAVTGRHAATASINSWSVGRKPVPRWVSDALPHVARKVAMELAGRAMMLHDLAGPRPELTPEQQAKMDAAIS
jgi:hypothetical protein